MNVKRVGENTRLVKYCMAALLLVLCMVTVQDLLHSRRHRYAFYLSESLLFNTYWLWFVPVMILFRRYIDSKQFLRGRHVYITALLFVTAASVLHAWAHAVTVYGISFFFYEATYDMSKMLGYTLANDFYKYIFVYAAAGIWLVRKGIVHKKEDPPSEDEQKSYPGAIVAGTGRNNILVPVQDILFITSESPYIALHTRDRKYLRLQTLKSVLQQLPSGQFIQVHKLAVVNLEKVVSYRSRLNGDYDIRLQDRQEVRLSRNYAPAFKKRFTSA